MKFNMLHITKSLSLKIPLNALIAVFGLFTASTTLAGPFDETFLSEHEGWRVFRNHHVASGTESCLVATFDYPSSFTALSDSNSYVHFMVKVDRTDPGSDLVLAFKTGDTYQVRQQLVQFPDYDSRVSFIERLYVGKGEHLTARNPRTGQTLAMFSLSGAEEGLNALGQCLIDLE